MQDVIITELETNLSFKASIDNPPEVKQSYTTVYVDEKELKRPTISQANGLIKVKVSVINNNISNFINRWYTTKKRINLMLETNEHMYLMKGCSIKQFKAIDENFVIFYNTFKEA